MADDEHDAGIDELLRRRLGLPGTACIIRANQADRATERAPARVEVADRKLCGGPVTRAGHGEGAGKRHGEPDPDLLRGTSPIDGQHHRDGEQEAWAPGHGSHLLSASKDDAIGCRDCV
jgi:hypothetical protein